MTTPAQMSEPSVEGWAHLNVAQAAELAPDVALTRLGVGAGGLTAAEAARRLVNRSLEALHDDAVRLLAA